IEVYGTEGSLAVPDPNHFDGEVRLGRRGAFEPAEPLAGYPRAGRGYGLADRARAIAAGSGHRQSAERGHHVSEVMPRVREAAAPGRVVPVRSRCERPDPVPAGADPASA